MTWLWRALSWLWQIRKIIVNSRIAFLSEKWARSIQEVANDFSVLVNQDVRNAKKYGNSQEVQQLAEKIDDINKKVHKTWEDMEQKLKPRS